MRVPPCVDERRGCKRAEVRLVVPAHGPRRSREGGNLASPAWRTGPFSLWEKRMRVPPCEDESGGGKSAEVRLVVPAHGSRHSSEGWNPTCATAGRTRGGGVRLVVPAHGPRHSSEGWNPACATAERTRGGGVRLVVPVHGPVIPAKAGIQARNEGAPCVDEGGEGKGAVGCASSFQRMAPVIPAKAGIQRARQRSAHGAEGCVRRSRAGPVICML